MALHLVTGYAGREHITSADQGAYNMATYGAGNFVLERGRKFAATVISNNSVSIADGEAMMQGRYIKMPSGTSEEIAIDNGSQGRNRNDLICIRYEKNASDSVESTSLVVIKGTETTGTATDPTYNNGTITDGNDTIADFPLYRVKLNGINIETVTALFDVKTSMVDYMDNYQIQPATSSRLGGVKTGDGITNNNGLISVPKASTTSFGSVKVGNGLVVGSDNKLNVDFSKIKRDIVRVLNSTSYAANSLGVYSYDYPYPSNKRFVISARYVVHASDNILTSEALIEDHTNSTSINFYIHNLNNFAKVISGTSDIEIVYVEL